MAQEVEFDWPRVEGKFLFLDNEKFFIKGTTYGSFPPNSQGCEFPEHAEIETDFALMRRAGLNVIRRKITHHVSS